MSCSLQQVVTDPLVALTGFEKGFHPSPALGPFKVISTTSVQAILGALDMLNPPSCSKLLSVLRQPLVHGAGTHVSSTRGMRCSFQLIRIVHQANMHTHMENESLQCLALVLSVPQSRPQFAQLLALAPSNLSLVVSFQLLALGSVAAAHLSSLKAGAGVSHGLREEGVLT